MSGVTFRTSGGQAPEKYILQVQQDAKPKAEEVLYTLERQKSRILERTANGVDVDGNVFEPYNSTVPYTYYPGGPVGRSKSTDKQKKSAAQRLRRKIGAGEVTASGGIKFSSYAAFKAALGRSGVDLRGPRAPHMLQALIATATETQGKLGIYGDAAGRASAHNSGYSPRWKGQHQRRFLGASDADISAMRADLVNQVRARLQK